VVAAGAVLPVMEPQEVEVMADHMAEQGLMVVEALVQQVAAVAKLGHQELAVGVA